jgi:hypothetical protein
VRVCSRASSISKASTEADDVQPWIIQIGKREVVVTAEDFDVDVMTKALEAKPLHEWANSIASEERIEVSSIHIQSADLFGLFGPTVGFITCKVNARIGNEDRSGIVFMRDSAVAVLMVLQHYNEKFTVLVRRARVPVGISDFAEIPAGTIDENGKFAGIAAEHMEERARIEIGENELIDMSFMAFGHRYPGVFPSPEAVHEHRSIYLYQRNVTSSELEDLRANLCGQHHDNIQFEVVPLDQLWRRSPDAKALAASCLYHRLADSGRLPEMPSLEDSPFSWDVWEVGSCVSSSIQSSFSSVVGMVGSI